MKLLRATVVLALAVAPLPALAQSGALAFTVDTTADEPDATPGDQLCRTATGRCSVLAALQEADANHGWATITVPPGRYAMAGGVAVDVFLKFELAGAGAATTVIEPAAPIMLNVIDSAEIDLADVTLRNVGDTINGLSTECPTGTLSLTRVALADADFPDTRHALAMSASRCTGCTLGAEDAVIEDTTVAGTIAVAERDPGCGTEPAAFEITRSTLRDGDGLLVFGAVGSIENTTLSGNGDAVRLATSFDESAVTLTHVTATQNDRGVVVEAPLLSGHVALADSIVAGNARTDVECDCDASGTCGAVDGTGLVNTSVGCAVATTAADARLGPLADNSGPTPTHALLPGSPAIDAAEGSSCPATDQRGAPRPWPPGGRCDVGAYETGCGNGFVDPGEACDDGAANGRSGDRCSPTCGAARGLPTVGLGHGGIRIGIGGVGTIGACVGDCGTP